MKILIAASECSPLVKVGGIADVIGSLPSALTKLSVDARVAIPFYKPLKEFLEKNTPNDLKHLLDDEIDYGNERLKISLYQVTTSTGIKTFLIDNPQYISNGGVYYSPETMPSPEAELYRFAIFSKALVKFFGQQNDIFNPDVLHCNDWHTGLVPQILQSLNRYIETEKQTPTVFTIHNLAYQGFSGIDVAEKLGLDMKTDQTLRWDAEDNNLDYLLQGLVGSTLLNTVSEKYAEEIQTPAYGEGLHDILLARKGRLFGIINGISYEIFNPATDKLIKYNFTTANWKSEKAKNKYELQKELGLNVCDKPMLGIVSRLAQQKGLDVVAESMEKIIKLGFQVVILGTGDPAVEQKLKSYNDDPRLNKDYKALIEFSEQKARSIYASSDAFLIPSRYEPCGLTQMIAMKYGSLPVVRATGGLYDTVDQDKTGFIFENLTEKELLNSLTYTADKYEMQNEWAKMVDTAMRKDFSWNESAKKYIMLYKKALTL